jgi:hypothetical protein
LNPFDDHAAEASHMSLRSVSPRPHADTSYHGGGKRDASAHRPQPSTGSADTSPAERRSMFTEDV